MSSPIISLIVFNSHEAGGDSLKTKGNSTKSSSSGTGTSSGTSESVSNSYSGSIDDDLHFNRSSSSTSVDMRHGLQSSSSISLNGWSGKEHERYKKY